MLKARECQGLAEISHAESAEDEALSAYKAVAGGAGSIVVRAHVASGIRARCKC